MTSNAVRAVAVPMKIRVREISILMAPLTAGMAVAGGPIDGRDSGIAGIVAENIDASGRVTTKTSLVGGSRLSRLMTSKTNNRRVTPS